MAVVSIYAGKNPGRKLPVVAQIALEWFVASVNSDVSLEMLLAFESLVAGMAGVLTQVVVAVGYVPPQEVHICEHLSTDAACKVL